MIKKKYVSEQIFVDLLYKSLKAKIISLNSSLVNKVGTSPSSVVNSIFCNILLNELDDFITKSEVLGKFRNGKPARTNHRFVAMLKPNASELVQAKEIFKNKGKLKYWKYLHKLRVAKMKLAKINNVERLVFNGLNRRLVYVRYVDDFIIFVWGTKSDCMEIKNYLFNFLKSELDLNLNIEKTQIIYFKKEKVNFLGFEIWQSPSTIPFFKKNAISTRKLDRNKMHSKIKAFTPQVSRTRITFSMEVILRKLVDKGLVRFKDGRFHPTSFKSVLRYDIPNIVLYLKAVFCGLTDYYKFAHNWYDVKTLYNYFGRFCLAMTLAHKTKSKVTKVFAKYGPNISVTDKSNKIVISYGGFTNVKNYKADGFCGKNVE